MGNSKCFKKQQEIKHTEYAFKVILTNGFSCTINLYLENAFGGKLERSHSVKEGYSFLSLICESKD